MEPIEKKVYFKAKVGPWFQLGNSQSRKADFMYLNFDEFLKIMNRFKRDKLREISKKYNLGGYKGGDKINQIRALWNYPGKLTITMGI